MARRPSPDSKTTMRDVAREAAVSITTVSRVINGDPYVADETSQRVQRAIDDLDYRINPLARSLRTGSDAAVGLIVESIGDPFFASVMHAVEEAARNAGLFLIIGSAGENADQERAVVTGLLNRSVQGLLISPCHLSYRRERLPIGRGGVPVVFIDRPSPGLGADLVVIDNAANARMATEHLIAHGHRRIGFAGTDTTRYPVSERLSGFRSALEDHGLAFDPQAIVDRRQGVDDATGELDRILESDDPVTALLIANATASQALIRELHRVGRTDVAVVSFDDFPMADVLDPAITVALQDPVLMGGRAFDLLLGRIQGNPGPPRKLVLPTTFIERGSGELAPLAAPTP